MQICSRCSTSAPDTAVSCPNCQADLSEWSVTALALKRFQENPRIKYVRISVAAECCPACRDVEGVYEKAALPKLPVEGCSHNLECRCFYLPVLEDLFP